MVNGSTILTGFGALNRDTGFPEPDPGRGVGPGLLRRGQLPGVFGGLGPPSVNVNRAKLDGVLMGVISAETRNVVRGVPAEPFNRRAHGSHLRGDTERGAWRAGGTPSNPPAKKS